jgi:hypothetical protein
MNPLHSLPEYERFIYTIAHDQPTAIRSTLVVVRRGATIAALHGELEFTGEVRLTVREKLSFSQSPGQIVGYGYEVWQRGELRYWYDSQPHPHDLALASTHPHHKHVPPDIKHHRVPAPELSFEKPNLPFLIFEVQQMLAAR